MPLVPKTGRLVPVKKDAPDDQMYQMLSAPLEGDAEITSREKYRSYARQKFGKDFSDVELDAIHNSVYGKDASYSSTITNLSNVYAVKSGGTVKNVPTIKRPTIGDYFRLATGGLTRAGLVGMEGLTLAQKQVSDKYAELVGNMMGERWLEGQRLYSGGLEMTAEGYKQRAEEGYAFWAGNVSDEVKQSVGGKAAGALGEIPLIAMYLHPATATVAAQINYGRMFSEGRDAAINAGKTDVEAGNIGLATMAINGTLEMVIDAMTAGIGGDLVKFGKPATLREGIKRIGLTAAKGQGVAVTEFLTEMAQSGVTQKLATGRIDARQAVEEGLYGWFVRTVTGSLIGGARYVDMTTQKNSFVEIGFTEEQADTLIEKLAQTGSDQQVKEVLAEASDQLMDSFGQELAKTQEATAGDVVSGVEEKVQEEETPDGEATVKRTDAGASSTGKILSEIKSLENEKSMVRTDRDILRGAANNFLKKYSHEEASALNKYGLFNSSRDDVLSKVDELWSKEKELTLKIKDMWEQKAPTAEEATVEQAHVEQTAQETPVERPLKPQGSEIITPEDIHSYQGMSRQELETIFPQTNDQNVKMVNAILNQDGSAFAQVNQGIKGIEAEPKTMQDETAEFRKEVGIPAGDIQETSGWISDTEQTPQSENVNRARSRLTSEITTPMLQFLKDIRPELYARQVRFETALHQRKRAYHLRAKPFLDTISKFAKNDSTAFALTDIDLLNGRFDDAAKNIPKEQIDEARSIFNDILDQYEEVGISVNRLENYWPRRVRDYEGLKEVLGSDIKSDIEKAVQEQMAKATEKGYTLSDSEISKIYNQVIAGSYHPVGERKPRAAQQRKIDEVTADIAPFYYDSIESAIMYMNDAADIIELRKFFGKDIKVDGDIVDLNESIGDIVAKIETEQNLSPKEVNQLIGAYRARFGYRPTGKIASAYKSIVAMTTLGQLQNAVTQFGDAAWSFYENGVSSTALAMFSKKQVTMEDLGFDEISEEFRTVQGLNGVVNHIFKYTGLKPVDKLGKDTLINASLAEYQRGAQDGRFTKEKQERLDILFGTNQEKILSDLKSGEITDDVNVLLTSTILDWQPVSLSNMPIAYLKSPNGRVLYTLKTFTVMQLDNFRRNGIDRVVEGISTGNAKMAGEGFKDLLRLAALFFLANVPIDIIKDMLTGKDFDLSDTAIDNIYKIAGLSRYSVEYASRGGRKPSEMIKNIFVPPLNFIDYPASDLGRIYDRISEGENADLMNLESWKLLPFVGRTIYYTVGRGEKNEEKRRDAEKKKTKNKEPLF